MKKNMERMFMSMKGAQEFNASAAREKFSNSRERMLLSYKSSKFQKTLSGFLGLALIL